MVSLTRLDSRRTRKIWPSLSAAHQEMQAIRQRLLAGPVPDPTQFIANDAVLVCSRQAACAPKQRRKRRPGEPRPQRRPPAHVQFPDDDLAELQGELLDGTYQPAQPDRRYEEDDTKPEIHQSLRDKIVENAVLLILGPVFEPYRQFHTGGWRPHVNLAEMMSWVRQLMPGRDWFVRADIKSCFESIRHDLIFRQLVSFVADRDLLYLLDHLLTSVQSAPGRGIGRGTVLAPLFADIAFSFIDDYFAPETYLHNTTHPRVPASEQQHLLAHLHLPQTPPGGSSRPLRRLARKDARGTWLLPSDRILNNVDAVAAGMTGRHDSHAVPLSRAHACALLPDTPLRRIVASPVPDYVRCYDDVLLLGVGDRKRASEAGDQLREVLAQVGLPSNPSKDSIGLLHEGFDLVGLHLRLVDGKVKITISQDRMEKLCAKIDQEIETKTNPEKILQGLHRFAHDSYQSYQQAGADCSVVDRYLDIQFWDRSLES